MSLPLNKLLEMIRGVRDRQSLTDIIHAAEIRDGHLAKLEAEEREKRLWATYGSHLKVGDTVFTHVEPGGKRRGKNDGFRPNEYKFLHHVGLRVRKVKPRSKEVVVVPIQGPAKGHAFELTAHMLATWKVSLDPTAESFGNALTDEVQQRRT